MKIKLLYLAAFIAFTNINAQVGFQNHVISTEVTFAYDVHASDIDGDGDNDILAIGENMILWYENSNGIGDFNIQHFIDDSTFKPREINTADIDGDGDIDVIVSLAGSISSIFWYENIDGQGDFGSRQIISDSNNARNSFSPADIDNDNDIDIVFAENDLNIVDRLYWGKNLGISTFGRIGWALNRGDVTTSDDAISSVFSIDIDNDGDIDIVSSDGFSTYWHENTNGLGDFTTYTIKTNGSLEFLNSVYASDIDGDGDNDVLSTINVVTGADRIVWYENTDGLGDFSDEKIIFTRNNGFGKIFTDDIDGDGDIDVLSVSSGNDSVSWYENIDGQGNFGFEFNITTEADFANSLYVSDLDNDGDKDIISASINDNKIAWYENLGRLGNIINGTIRQDENSDGCDIDDLTIPNLMVISNNGENTFGTFSQNNGNYIIYTNPGNFNTIINTNLPDYYSVNPTSHSSTFVELNNLDTADFCLEVNQAIDDVNIVLLPLSDVRPGFDANYQLVFQNTGTTLLNGNIILEYDDSKLNFLDSSINVATQTINSLTFNYNDLKPFEIRAIDINFNAFAPPITKIDDILNFISTINPISNDNTENDNIFELKQTVIGSFDPNDILVLEGDEILIEDTNEYLHYIIRFQNTGTADAINVKITNTLNSNLDWTTLQLQNSSHKNRVEIIDGNEIVFYFDGINLPDNTTDEEGSNGFIAYKIKPKNDIIVGDVIPNKADIFFDFNPAIETNTVSTEIVNTTLGINDNEIENINIYPNPTKDILNIKSNSPINKITIYNNLGQIVLLANQKSTINVSSLETGLYFMKIEDFTGKIGVRKLVKD